MHKTFDVVFLLALPASGKSELRRLIASVGDEQRSADFHMGPTVQLDDFPYVHFMRKADETLARLNQAPLYFQAPDKSFIDPWDFGTLAKLLDEDCRDLANRTVHTPERPARWMFERIDAAEAAADARIKFSVLDKPLREELMVGLDELAAELLREKHANIPESLDGKTVVVEFARGGPDGAGMPLTPPAGYGHSLAQFDAEFLRRAVALYVWVTPEESRRKNLERADPNDPGSILAHGVPEAVMRSDYGCDDIGWLLENSGAENRIRIETSAGSVLVPTARFDNRGDLTSFLRDPRDSWSSEALGAVHGELAAAMVRLVG